MKSLALTLITTVSIIGSANAQEIAEKTVEDKPSVQQGELAKLLGVGSDAPSLDSLTWVQGDEAKSFNLFRV